jgi:UDP-N-acetylmuramyl tripeptide synthase
MDTDHTDKIKKFKNYHPKKHWLIKKTKQEVLYISNKTCGEGLYYFPRRRELVAAGMQNDIYRVTN